MAESKNYVETFMERLKPVSTAGVLVFSDRKDKTAKSFEKDHPHLEFLLCYDKNVATELGYEFPSVLLLRDGEILVLPDNIGFKNKERNRSVAHEKVVLHDDRSFDCKSKNHFLARYWTYDDSYLS